MIATFNEDTKSVHYKIDNCEDLNETTKEVFYG